MYIICTLTEWLLYVFNRVFKSSVIKTSLNPEWTDNTTLSAPSTNEIIKVVCLTVTIYYNNIIDDYVVFLKLIEFFPIFDRSIYTQVILLSTSITQ